MFVPFLSPIMRLREYLRRVLLLLLLLLLLLRCLSGGDVAAGWASCGRRQCTPPRPSTTQHKVGSCRQPQTQEFSLQQLQITKCPLRLQSLNAGNCAAVCEACANRTYGTQNQFEKVAARCCVPAPVSRSFAIKCVTPTLHRRLLCGLWHALSK